MGFTERLHPRGHDGKFSAGSGGPVTGQMKVTSRRRNGDPKTEAGGFGTSVFAPKAKAAPTGRAAPGSRPVAATGGGFSTSVFAPKDGPTGQRHKTETVRSSPSHTEASWADHGPDGQSRKLAGTTYWIKPVAGRHRVRAGGTARGDGTWVADADTPGKAREMAERHAGVAPSGPARPGAGKPAVPATGTEGAWSSHGGEGATRRTGGVVYNIRPVGGRFKVTAGPWEGGKHIGFAPSVAAAQRLAESEAAGPRRRR